MPDKMNPPGGSQGGADLNLAQQYAEQVIRLAGAQRMQKRVHDDRVKTWNTLTSMLANLKGLSCPHVKAAALAFSEAPRGEGVRAYDRLTQALIEYRDGALRKGEGQMLVNLEKALAHLIETHASLVKQELALQKEAEQHQAEALRLKTLQQRGPGGIQ